MNCFHPEEAVRTHVDKAGVLRLLCNQCDSVVELRGVKRWDRVLTEEEIQKEFQAFMETL